jgi:hypothetical protein
VHTVDAATAVTRLTNLGLEAYKVAESLAAVLAQRLFRVGEIPQVGVPAYTRVDARVERPLTRARIDMTLRPRRWSRVIGLVALVAGISVPCVDASISVGVLKATFLYNFAKFTEWPTDVLAPGQRLLLCVVGDADVAEALEQTIKGRMLDGHTLEVQVVTLDALPTFPCHVLYISSNDLKRSAARLAALRTVPTLTVSDGDKLPSTAGSRS